MLSPSEIVIAYQLLLGRDPESQQVVDELAHSNRSVDELRETFYKSPEFLKHMGDVLQTSVKSDPRHPFVLPEIPVEVDCSNEQLAQMLLRISKEWEHLGESDPYWSVITQPYYHLNEFEPHRDQFYKSGQHTEYVYLASLRRCGVNPNLLKSCLDFGCGVGRITSHLSKTFESVIGVDVSKSHLQLAREHLDSENSSNVQLIQLTDFNILSVLPKVDTIISVITLQHNPPPIISYLIKSLLALLNPGGAAYFQVPTYRNGYLFEVERYLNSTPPDTLEMHFLPQKDVFKAIAESNCELLEVREDKMAGREDIMLSNSFVVRKRS